MKLTYKIRWFLKASQYEIRVLDGRRAKSLQSCPSLCDPMDGSPPENEVLSPWGSPGKNLGVGCHALPQGSFPHSGRWVLCHVRHLGNSLKCMVVSDSVQPQGL